MTQSSKDAHERTFEKMEVGDLYGKALNYLGLHEEDIQGMREDLSDAVG
jgi:hypothetical protein